MNKLLLLLALSSKVLFSMEGQSIDNQPGSSKQKETGESIRLWKLLDGADVPPLFFVSAASFVNKSNDELEELSEKHLIPQELKDSIVSIKNDLGKKLVKLLENEEILNQEDKQNITFLINAGANLDIKDSSDNTPLLHAARYGHNDILQLLIDKNANLNLQNANGETALLVVLTMGFPQTQKILKSLIEKGADINLQSNHSITPLIMAAALGDKDLVEILLEKGADINHQTINGNTALMEAINHHGRTDTKDTVKLLLSKGANATLKNTDSKTALDIARERNYQEIVNLLENAED